MSRPFTGDEEVLKRARQTIRSNCTLEQFRQAQAVLLPLDHAMSLTATAAIISFSPGWRCQLRRRFIQSPSPGVAGASGAGGRKRQNMNLQEEREFLAPFAAFPLLAINYKETKTKTRN